jgi:multimeric flavodoxin WrbA
MNSRVDRRSFLALGATTAATALATTSSARAADAAVAAAPAGRPLLLLGIACSPRPGKTTAVAVRTALEAAAAVDARIRTEFIDLGGRRIAGWSPTPVPDDFEEILPRLKDPAFGGLILGSPSFFRSLSSLCKAFIERCMPLREPPAPLADKPVGALALAGNRNGGQELVVQQILTAMLSYRMIPVGGESPAMLGGTLWNQAGDDLTKDEVGLQSARLLGAHVARIALRLAP